MTPGNDAPPAHDSVGPIARTIEVVCLLGAGALLVVQAFRLAAVTSLAWWTPLVLVGAGVTADLLSGLVHWTADTWGRETLPVLGRRFLRPFRVHHINPHDFLRRDFIDCNGDVAMLVLPMLAAFHADSARDPNGRRRRVSSCGRSPRGCCRRTRCTNGRTCRNRHGLVAWLQRRGVILSREAHHEHHVSPYVVNYCIATGWCNRWLTRQQVFPRLERMVARVTGMLPRADEAPFVAHLRANPGDGRR